MGRRGNPYDNAKAESFMKTLKVEEVYLMEYEIARTGDPLSPAYYLMATAPILSDHVRAAISSAPHDA